MLQATDRRARHMGKARVAGIFGHSANRLRRFMYSHPAAWVISLSTAPVWLVFALSWQTGCNLSIHECFCGQSIFINERRRYHGKNNALRPAGGNHGQCAGHDPHRGHGTDRYGNRTCANGRFRRIGSRQEPAFRHVTQRPAGGTVGQVVEQPAHCAGTARYAATKQ